LKFFGKVDVVTRAVKSRETFTRGFKRDAVMSGARASRQSASPPWQGPFKRELGVVHHMVCNMFDLHNLGWNDFQRLCLTITREILGQAVESFLDSGDGGRDGAFAGEWKPSGQENLSGPFVIQCKFTSNINYVL